MQSAVILIHRSHLRLKTFKLQQTEMACLLVLKTKLLYSGFPRIRNHFLGYSLLFLNNSLLFYPLFYIKVEICFLYKGVSYLREPAVNHCGFGSYILTRQSKLSHQLSPSMPHENNMIGKTITDFASLNI